MRNLPHGLVIYLVCRNHIRQIAQICGLLRKAELYHDSPVRLRILERRPALWPCALIPYCARLKTCSCCLLRYFGTLFWDDFTKVWDENLSLFTFLIGKLRKNLFWTIKKFVYL